MARFHAIAPDGCRGRTRELYRRALAHELGPVELLSLLANSPAAMEGYLGLAEAMSRGTLSERLREFIALAVSARNGSAVDARVHEEHMRRLGVEDPVVLRVSGGDAAEPRTREVLRFALALVEKGGQVETDDIERLRAAGVSDAECIEIAAQVMLTLLANVVHRLDGGARH